MSQDLASPPALHDVHSSYPPLPNSPVEPSIGSTRTSYATADGNGEGDSSDSPDVGSIRSVPSRTRIGTPHPIASSHDTTSEAVPPTPASTITPAMQMRLSVFTRLRSGVLQLRCRTKLVLAFQGFMTLAQVVAFSTILGLSSKDTCDKPLRTFLALHIVRVAFSWPISFYNALAPKRPARGETDTEEDQAHREARRAIGNSRLDARLRTLSDIIALFSLIWFLIGNIWVYSSGNCKATSPELWYSSLTVLIIAYLRVAEVVFIVLAVVFFLPVVILGLRMFGGLEKKHEIGPLTKEEIAKLPVVLYIPAPEDAAATAAEKPEVKTEEVTQLEDGVSGDPPAVQTASPDVAASAATVTKSSGSETVTPPSPSTSTAPPRRRRQLLRLFFKRQRNCSTSSSTPATSGSNGLYVPTPFPLHPLPDNLSSCPICLSDYEPPPLLTASKEEQKKADEVEPLNLLPCDHAIHRDCLAPWLQTSGRCPVCQQAIFPNTDGKDKKGRRRRRNTGTAAPATAADATPAEDIV